MTVKLSPHFQTLPKWASKVNFPGDWVKVMDPGRGISSRFPGKRIVGRWYVKDESQYIETGEIGADNYFDLLAAKYEETRQDIAVIEGINEPACQTKDQVEQLGVFLERWIEVMQDHGYAVAVPAFSVGNPPEWVMGTMHDVWASTDYLSLHEYGLRRMDEEWHGATSLRHRMLYARLNLDALCPPLLITETGIDRGGDGYRHKPNNTPWKEYLAQLVWYEQELQQDSYVEAAFLFSSGSTQTWRSFDVGEGEWRDLVKRLA